MRTVLLGALVLVALAPSAVDAQDVPVAGAIDGFAVIADGDYGGGAMVDVWARFDWFRVGGFLGVSSVSSARDTHNRIAMPIGVSISLYGDLGDAALELRLRGGAWGGATQEVKLTGGGFLGGGLYLLFDVGNGASLGAGMEAWGILGQGETWAITPALSLAWGAPVAPPAEIQGDEGFGR